MKERLQELGIKTTELSSYMKVSRPSLYKYINLYEKGETQDIPEKVLRTFRFVDKSKKTTKEQVISFVILEFSDSNNVESKEVIRNFLLNKSEKNPKVQLMYNLITKDSLDGLVEFLLNASDILDSDEIDDEGLYQVARLVNLRNDVMKNMPLTDEELMKAKEILGDRYVG